MWNVLQWIKQHLSILLPIVMVAGFLFGITFESMAWGKQFILPLTIFMVLPMMIMFPVRQLFTNGISMRLLLVNLLVNFVIFPLFVFGLGRFFFADNPGFMLGIFMLGLIPTSGMTISWTGFAKGNMKAAVSLTVIGLLLGAVLAPVYLSLMLGKSSSVPMGSIFVQILLVVFLPMVIGNLIRMLLVKTQGEQRFKTYWKQRIPTLSSLGVLLIVFLAIALKAKTLVKDPSQVIIALVPILIFYAVAYAVSTFTARIAFNRVVDGVDQVHFQGTSLVFSTVMRNLSIVLAIAVTAFPEYGGSAALVLALAYALQVQTASLYVRYADKLLRASGSKRAAREIRVGAAE